MRKIFILSLLALISCQGNQKEEVYYNNGQLSFEVPLMAGKRHGTSKRYYQSGELFLVSNWDRGKKEGESIAYYKNGNVKSIERFKAGVGHGFFEYYDSTGNLTEKMMIKNDLEHGVYYKYYPSGTMKVQAHFKNGVRSGRAEYYYSDGLLQGRDVFVKDTVAYSVEYNKVGNIEYSFIPISTEFNQNEVVINLNQTYLDEPMIGLIIGNLDEELNLTDTMQMIDTIGNQIRYKLRDSKVSGYVYEIDPETMDVINKFPLNLRNLEKKQNEVIH